MLCLRLRTEALKYIVSNGTFISVFDIWRALRMLLAPIHLPVDMTTGMGLIIDKLGI